MAVSEGLPYDDDLSRIREAVQRCATFPVDLLQAEDGMVLNPSLEAVQTKWSGLCGYLENDLDRPVENGAVVLVWMEPVTGIIRCLDSRAEDLLALKIISESIDLHKAAVEGGVSIGAIEAAIGKAVDKGLIIKPPPSIRRDESFRSTVPAIAEEYMSAEIFTLQWHITQACDLHCKHCYDRSDRVVLGFKQAVGILDDLRNFCDHNGVSGQVTFTGGNPLLYPRFLDIYREAAERGFFLAILGNPTSGKILDEIRAIRRPEFFQVSLEGLEEHNDAIRGAGHFKRVLEFLKVLKEKEIFSMVMLTLTSENKREVLPLAELLRDWVDLFTFNRLTLFGEGASLHPIPVEDFAEFLEQYRQAAAANPIMSLKDNLFNRIQYIRGRELFGGCAGFGCGAAFNFVSLLPDGEVHACRKFPSLIGNAYEQSLQELYNSEAALRYRSGSEACGQCLIRATCRGCPAVAAGHGLDPHKERDPYCQGVLNVEKKEQ